MGKKKKNKKGGGSKSNALTKTQIQAKKNIDVLLKEMLDSESQTYKQLAAALDSKEPAFQLMVVNEKIHLFGDFAELHRAEFPTENILKEARKKRIGKPTLLKKLLNEMTVLTLTEKEFAQLPTQVKECQRDTRQQYREEGLTATPEEEAAAQKQKQTEDPDDKRVVVAKARAAREKEEKKRNAEQQKAVTTAHAPPAKLQAITTTYIPQSFTHAQRQKTQRQAASPPRITHQQKNKTESSNSVSLKSCDESLALLPSWGSSFLSMCVFFPSAAASVSWVITIPAFLAVSSAASFGATMLANPLVMAAFILTVIGLIASVASIGCAFKASRKNGQCLHLCLERKYPLKTKPQTIKACA